MKKVVFLLILCLTAFMNGYSQSTQDSIKYSQIKQDSIKVLFHLMRQDSLMDKMFKSTFPLIMKQMQSRMVTKDSASRARANLLLDNSKQTMNEISKRIIDEDLVLVYEKYFSQNEINDFIVFYKTPSGQKLIHTAPDIQKELRMIMMQKYIPEIQKTIKAKAEELNKAEQK